MRTLFLLSLSVLAITGCQSTPSTDSNKTIVVHGHRGSRGTKPENTLPAFQDAVAAGVQVLELDLHLTKDKVPVLSHDPEITSKLCRDSKGKPVSKPVPIRTITAKQFKTYDCGNMKHPDYPEQVLVPKTSKPTFEEFLQWAAKNAPTLEFNVETKMDEEVKSNNPDPKVFAEKVIALMKKYDVVKRSILQSFDYTTLDAAKKIEPGLRIATLIESGNVCDPAIERTAPITSPDFHLLNAKEVERCHSKGILVIPWTANTEADWKNLIEMGVDGIITDYPLKLVTYMKTPKK